VPDLGRPGEHGAVTGIGENGKKPLGFQPGSY
jgi:hypothetical protein